MIIADRYSHLGGLEALQVRVPEFWNSVESSLKDASFPLSRGDENRSEANFLLWDELIKARLWKRLECGYVRSVDESFGLGAIGKNGCKEAGIRIGIQFGSAGGTMLSLAKHLAFYVGDTIDVGVEVLPMKEMQAEMSSGPGYFEGALYDLVRQGRGVPAVPLVIVGVLP